VLARHHAAELHAADRALGAREELHDLAVDGLVLPLQPELEQDLRVLDPLLLRLELVERRLDAGALAILLLGALLVVPIARLCGLRSELR
jgi:hypothetical protein